MDFVRLPRFKRCPNVRPIRITERDASLLVWVGIHRVLTSVHLRTLLGPGSHQNLLRRLRLLYDRGLLDRPRSQIDYFHRGGARPMVYTLTPSGERLVRTHYEVLSDWLGHSHHSPWGRRYLEHALAVSDILVALFRAGDALDDEVRLLYEHQLDILLQPERRSLAWTVDAGSLGKLSVIPDRVVQLRTFTGEDEAAERVTCFIEADRGTMPVIRRDGRQTSVLRKLVAYEASWRKGLLQKRYPTERFRVLIVTTNPARVEQMVKVCQRLESGHGLFLFTDHETFAKHPNVYSLLFANGRGAKDTLLTHGAAVGLPYYMRNT